MVCVHEAGHALIYALGGFSVQGLAVAPEGCEWWSHLTQRGVEMNDLWGVCELPDGPILSQYLEWDDEQLCYRANRAQFINVHHSMAANLRTTQRKQVLADLRRFVRLRVCAALAGPIAETYYEQRNFDVWDTDGWLDRESDVEIAQGLAGLLPYRSEFEHACTVTCDALRRPEIWARVIALADELERTGDMSPDAIAEYLPCPDFDWPRSPAVRWRGQRVE
ncbi:hypothetical protein CR51_40960 [Caballeronia megalochromosomata]|nr:hypothetical protein CR51_40960 [Caballeronia megalochromosomata]